MDVYMYQAALYCEECGIKIRAELASEGKAPEDSDDESGYDSDDFPKGPYYDGGGEADTAQHCDGCKVFLENPLTEEGERDVTTRIEESIMAQLFDSVACTEWLPFYQVEPFKDGFTVAIKNDNSHSYNSEYDVKLLDDSCDFFEDLIAGESTFFAAGFEWGPHVLVHARSFESAWETWVDESETIPEDELIEAYGIVDDYRATFEEDDPCPKDRPFSEAWDAWHARFKAACVERLKKLGDNASAGIGEYPELIEGYAYQSNASGTGIVSMGHYAWMNEIDPKDIVIRRKDKDNE